MIFTIAAIAYQHVQNIASSAPSATHASTWKWVSPLEYQPTQLTTAQYPYCDLHQFISIQESDRLEYSWIGQPSQSRGDKPPDSMANIYNITINNAQSHGDMPSYPEYPNHCSEEIVSIASKVSDCGVMIGFTRPMIDSNVSENVPVMSSTNDAIPAPLPLLEMPLQPINIRNLQNDILPNIYPTSIISASYNQSHQRLPYIHPSHVLDTNTSAIVPTTPVDASYSVSHHNSPNNISQHTFAPMPTTYQPLFQYRIYNTHLARESLLLPDMTPETIELPFIPTLRREDPERSYMDRPFPTMLEFEAQPTRQFQHHRSHQTHYTGSFSSLSLNNDHMSLHGVDVPATLMKSRSRR